MTPTRARLAVVLGFLLSVAVPGPRTVPPSPPPGDAATGPDRLVAISGGPDSCGDNDHLEAQGGTAGTVAKACQGFGLVFIGPAIGQVSSVIGPTVIGPAQVTTIQSAGNVSVTA